ncbi:septation protein SepH [Arthrobacter sp.]|uniref:septation protein SepH n=1 Tax=Arthrobacter sp. TaxID=1667 RepID=UPI003A8E91E8
MQQLRLVGVQEDGEHLLLGSDDGSSFVLRIDEALRAAAARPIGRPAAATAEREPTALSPREIQARIRTGSTAEQVAQESGLPLEHVMRYEGPVRAERDYIAQLARGIEVSSPQGHDTYRSAFGDEPASLGEMVSARLSSMGVDSASLQWDAWRRSDGSWDVSASFDLSGSNTESSIGEEPPALWVFHPARKSLHNSNRWAQVLSEMEPAENAFTNRRLTAVADRPFDFESDAGGDVQPAEGDPAGPSAPGNESEELLDILRARRGQRLGVDEDGDDALALLLSQGSIPAAHPRDEEFVDEGEARRLGFAPAHDASDDDESLPRLHDGVSTNTTEYTVIPGLSAEDFRHADESVTRHDDADDEGGPSRKKAKRSSVPSWDEIVFGKKRD